MGKPIEMSRDFTVRLRQAGIALVEKRISMLKGEAGLSHVVYDSGEESEVDGLFVAIGDAPPEYEDEFNRWDHYKREFHPG